MVGRWTLNPAIEVRVLEGEPLYIQFTIHVISDIMKVTHTG